MTESNSSVGRYRFSTDDVPPRDRLAVWREEIGRVLMRFDIETPDDAPLRGVLERHTWWPASLYFIEVSALTTSRTPELIQDGDGDFRLLSVEGGFQFTANGETQNVGSNCAALLFNGAVSSARYFGPHRATSIRLHRERLTSAVLGLDDRPIRRIEPGSPPQRLLNSYVKLLRQQQPSNDPVMASQVAQHVVDLVALAIGPTDEIRSRSVTQSVRQTRIATIREDVLANLQQVRLSAKTVAQRHGVTDRYIHLLFEETGKTFSRFVEEERLKLAYKLLTDPTHKGKRISEIAFKVGFGELSTFNRAFRRHFGDTPRGARQQPNKADDET